MSQELRALDQTTLGELLMQQIIDSNMGIDGVVNSELSRNRRKQYAVEYISQMKTDSMTKIRDNIWSMSYMYVFENFVEYWSQQLVGHWRGNQRGYRNKIYISIRNIFEEIFEKELVRESQQQNLLFQTSRMILQFEGIGYLPEPHFMHAIEKAAAIVDLTILLDAS